MKCGTNTTPPSSDPYSACLGPGFISIMHSIYSFAMTRGYWRASFFSEKQTHPPNPVWKDGLIHRYTMHDTSAKPHFVLEPQKRNRCLNKQQISVLWMINKEGLHLLQWIYCNVFTYLETSIHKRIFSLFLHLWNGRFFASCLQTQPSPLKASWKVFHEPSKPFHTLRKWNISFHLLIKHSPMFVLSCQL